MHDPIVSIRLPEPIRQQLRAAAKRDDRDVSSFTRRLITSALQQYDKKNENDRTSGDVRP